VGPGGEGLGRQRRLKKKSRISRSKACLKVNRFTPDVVAQAKAVTVADVRESKGLAGRAALMGARMRPLQHG
jgi:hypothetical protein